MKDKRAAARCVACKRESSYLWCVDDALPMGFCKYHAGTALSVEEALIGYGIVRKGRMEPISAAHND